ncbi:MarR family winged helix-turn-helix transcriptional regulator [Kiloniella laminariae]|uniref:MarR family winged helix-turn-helix transcriptional regulator n=1 Tax=Kiloniella laminariae TaxID=454162 RepID=UPI000399B231|nr:MarR family transcriptional regulator [Kiloniella laminariae]
MTDIKSGTNPLFLRTDEIMQAIELLFFAYRDFTGEPDELLAEYNFGRAHHRVIHFVGRHPGITVSELLLILRITKQSLSRVLGQLVREGFIRQTPGPVDRRQRLLKLTAKGQELDDKLFEVQRQRIVRAYKESGAEAVAGFRSVLLNMMEENDRQRFSR